MVSLTLYAVDMGEAERRGKFHVAGPAKLVNRLHPIEAISRAREDRGITGEGHRVAGHRGDARHLCLGDLAHLRLGPRAGRVDDEGVIAHQFGGQKRTAEQVAGFRCDRLQPCGVSGTGIKRCEKLSLRFHGVNGGPVRKR
jgi:hypothetical protein